VKRCFNILRWLLSKHSVMLLALCAGAALFMGILVAISDSVEPQDFQALLDKLPPALQAMIGLKGHALTRTRWLAFCFNHPLWLVLVLAFPLTVGRQGIAGAISDGSLELVLAQPIRRSVYLLALTLLLVLGCLAVTLSSFGAAILAVKIMGFSKTVSVSMIAQITASGCALGLAVGGLSLLASASLERAGTAAVVFVVFAFFLQLLAKSWPAAAWLKCASLFAYHDPQAIVDGGLTLGSFGILLGFAALTTALAFGIFERRALTF